MTGSDKDAHMDCYQYGKTALDPAELRRLIEADRAPNCNALNARHELADYLWGHLDAIAASRDAVLEEAALAVTDGSIFRDEGGEKAAEAIRALKSGAKPK